MNFNWEKIRNILLFFATQKAVFPVRKRFFSKYVGDKAEKLPCVWNMTEKKGGWHKIETLANPDQQKPASKVDSDCIRFSPRKKVSVSFKELVSKKWNKSQKCREHDLSKA